MTRIVVHGGSCGFVSRVIVAKERKAVRISIESDCDMVKAWGAHLDSLPLLELLNPRKALRFQESALRHIKHVTCPVPLSVLKAVEVEAGAALPRDVRIHFVDGKDQSLEGEDL